MSQVRQIGWGIGAAFAFGAIVYLHEFAADATARGATSDHGNAMLGASGSRAGSVSGSTDAFRALLRQPLARNESAKATDSQWYGQLPRFNQGQLGLKMEAECASYPTWADKLLNQVKRVCRQGLTGHLRLAGNLPPLWNRDYAVLPGAVATPSGLWIHSRTSSRVPPELAAEPHAAPALLYSALISGAWLLLAYAGYLAALALFQKRFVFNPTHATGRAADPAHTHEITPIRLPLARGKAIKGWFLRPRQGKAPYPSIIYYGGRSEEVSWLQGAVRWFPRHAVLALNYRGYGESEGYPTERGLFADGLAQFDWLAAQPGVDPRGIVLVGRSLGTGVASYVAANRPAERVVLITPYDSLLAVARRRFRFTPLTLLLRHKFRSVDYARKNTQPCLALLAEHDDVVPEEHTHRLMAVWAGAKELVRIPCTTHLDIPYQAATLRTVAIWLGYASASTAPSVLPWADACSLHLESVAG